MASTTFASPVRTTSPRQWWALAGFIASAQGAGIAGALSTSRELYDDLEKPPLSPPPAVFGPVWTALYLLMGVAAWRIWRSADSPRRTRALRWWWVQLLLNAAWTPIFFGAGQIELALVDIAALLAALGFTVKATSEVDDVAPKLLVPYVLWVLFATYLNAGFVVRN